MIGVAETNTCWPKVGMSLSLFERTKEWFEARFVKVGYNTMDKYSPRSQPGGVATIVTNKMAYKISESGVDNKNLGR